MNQAELINEVAAHLNNTGIAKSSIKNVLDALETVVHAELKKGGEVTLPGFGKLTVKKRAAREGRNPATGEAMKIKAKKVPHFSAAKALKDAVA